MVNKRIPVSSLTKPAKDVLAKNGEDQQLKFGQFFGGRPVLVPVRREAPEFCPCFVNYRGVNTSLRPYVFVHVINASLC